MLMNKFIDKLREEQTIPIEYDAFKDNEHKIWYAVIEKIKPEIFHSELEYDKENISVYDCYGVIKGKYFMLVKLMDVKDRYELHLVFTNDFKRLHKEYLYKKKIKTKRVIYGAGLYQPVNSMFGYVLKPLPLRETIRPILNDNLFEMLNIEIDGFCSKEHIYKDMGLQYKRGILLYGSCGNGKTCFVKHLLNDRTEAIGIICEKNDYGQISFLSDFLADRDYKDILKIIVLEDIDGMDSEMRSLLLNFLDGITPVDKTIFIATTNFPEKLDIAIRNRPSRFDSVHEIGLPNKKSRKQLIKSFFKDISNGDLVECAIASKGFSGAYFKEIYILSKLNDWTPNEAIEELKRRFKMFTD